MLQNSISETIVFVIINNALKSFHFRSEGIEYLAKDSKQYNDTSCHKSVKRFCTELFEVFSI